MQMFGGGKQWRISQITAGFPHFTIQILTMSRDINNESKQAEICQSFTCQKFLMRNSPKLPPAKHSRYTVDYTHARYGCEIRVIMYQN